MAATIYEPLSTAHLKACTVDFDSRPDKKAVNLVQYDQTIPVLCVSLKKGGTEYKVPSDADVNIRMDKRDGYHVYNPALGVNAERAIAYFAVTPQMSTGWGDYYPIVEITVGGGVAGSAPIWLHFDRNPLPENAIISSDEYKTIQQLLEDVKAVKADTEAIKTATEQIKAQTEAVRDQAKGFADNAKNSADKAQTLVDGMPSDYSQAMKDIGTLKNQMQLAYPDDSTIGENTWSSKNIVDMLCPPLEESGNPVVCYPIAGYPLGVKAKWEPVQEGTGTPSPENIRPIKGRDSVTVDRCGENVIEFLSTEDSSSDIKIAVDAEKNITLNGTLAGKGNITIGTCRLHWVAGKTYTMYVKKVGGSVSLGSGDGITFAYALFTTDYNHFFRGGTNSTNLDVYIASDAALVETELVFMLQCWRKGTVFNNFKFQIEVVEGTTTPSTYAPYNGQTNTLTLPETVYGGEVDAVTGSGRCTWNKVSLDGTENWIEPSSNAYYAAFGYIPSDGSEHGVASHYPYGTRAKNLFANKNGAIVLYGINDILSINEWKSFLAAQYAAGTPVQVCYKLAEPVPFTATGAQPLSALAGANTVLTDADSTTVTGRADPIKRIEDLEAAVASIN